MAPYGLHPTGRTTGSTRVASEVDKEIFAHGVSVVEVRRSSGSNDMAMVRGSRYNRRVTSATEMVFTGPAAGNAQLVTRFSANGTRTRGTNNNCANGYTPWGTYLTCEENFHGYFGGDANGLQSRSLRRLQARRLRHLLRRNRQGSAQCPSRQWQARRGGVWCAWNCDPWCGPARGPAAGVAR